MFGNENSLMQHWIITPAEYPFENEVDHEKV
jgi:hypothetical protein